MGTIASSASTEPSIENDTAAPVTADEVELVARAKGTAPEVDNTPLEISDDIRMGVLDNGLTYYVQSNDRPGSKVSARMAVRAGGFHEDPLGTGAAHFLEHMMFNGTERWPGTEVQDVLRSIGATIGPDTNAATGTEFTFYEIDVEDTGQRVETAFDVLQQWAGFVTFDEGAVDQEALVVREEVRFRDESGDGLVGVAFDDAYHAETPFEGVNVTGTAASVLALTGDDLQAYYDRWYRPDNMAIVAVGDRSLDDLERLITDRFTDLEARGQTVDPSVPEFDLRTEPYVETLIEPAFGDSFISIDVPLRTWDRNTIGGQRLEWTEVILGLMVDQRLSESVDSGQLDMRRAGGGYFTHNTRLAYMGFNGDAEDLEVGTEAMLTAIEATISDGFTQSELDRAKATVGAFLDQRLETEGTIQDDEIASAMVFHFLQGGDLLSVDDSVDLIRDILSDLTLEKANNHYQWIMTGSEPIIVVVGPDEARVGQASNHLAAIEKSRAADFGGFEDDIVEIDQLMDRPDAVEEIRSSGLARVDGFELEFDNGMRVLFTPSTVSEGEVTVVSESPGGRLELDPDEGSVATTAVDAVAASGVADYSRVQVRRYLADLEVGIGPYLADASEGFSGSAAASDLEVLFQLLHLQATQPRVEDVAFAQQVEFARDLVTEVGLDPSTAADVLLNDALTGGGVLASSPTLDDLDTLTTTDALEIYSDRFSQLDNHVVAVVGDVDDDVVRDLARRYIGTLPAAGDTETPAPLNAPGTVRVEETVGSGSASGAFRLLHVAEADETIRNQVLAEFTTSVLDDRVFTVIREQLGATYGGFSSIEFQEPGDGVELYVSIDGDPGRIDEIADTVDAQLQSLAMGGLRTVDFDEAFAVLASRYNFINNGYFVDLLFDEAYKSDNEVKDRERQFRALSQIDAGDIERFVQLLIGSDDMIDVRVVPG
ncbi:MAG: hypothetical protein HKN94_08815 [Acidimicrobiales bacterium]|nr:hypothetical protein [Acidimicrobiales bacterium]